MSDQGKKAKKKPKKGQPTKSGAARFTMMLWLASGLTCLTLLWLWTEPAAKVFTLLDADPPGLSMWMLTVGTWATRGLGMLFAAAILAATVLPYALGLKGPNGTRFYASLAVIGILASGGAWLGLKRPMDKVAENAEWPSEASPR